MGELETTAVADTMVATSADDYPRDLDAALCFDYRVRGTFSPELEAMQDAGDEAEFVAAIMQTPVRMVDEVDKWPETKDGKRAKQFPSHALARLKQEVTRRKRGALKRATDEELKPRAAEAVNLRGGAVL
jgi:hypothetical protein